MSNLSLRRLLYRISRIRYVNRWLIFLMDWLLSVFATLSVGFFLKYLLNYDLTSRQGLMIGLYSATISLLAIWVFRTYTGVIRYSTLREVWRILLMSLSKVIFCGTLIYFRGYLTNNQALVFFFMDFFLTFVLLLILRIGMLAVYNAVMLITYQQKKNVLIYGIGEPSVMLSQGSTKVFMHDYVVRGFVTPDPQNRNFRLSGYPVYSVTSEEELKELIVKRQINGILFPNMELAKKEQDRILAICNALNVSVLVVPHMEEVKEGVIHHRIRRIKIEDLLGRDEIKINMQEIGNLLTGKTVLVTGAAGSIGSEICRQLARFDIKRLICFDMGETPLHNLRLELEEKFPGLEFTPVIGDVRSVNRTDYVFRNYQPQVVFHAAAYKHVPLMEENPCEAIRVNVSGSRNVADMAVKYGVERFVMVSTDKAVNPTNIMGCSKRLAEIYVQSLSIALKNGEVKGRTKFITTRFGNVLGSNGSVIPRFKEQIKNGGPVTVTHPDIIRFFMTIPEACRLVLEAGTMGNGGEIFVFDMGEPVRIADLARRMISLAGFRPDKDIEVKYTGLRPGEKLYEEVLSDEEGTKPTPHEKIRVAAVREYTYAEVVPCIDKLTHLASAVNIPEMVQEMKAIVPEFKSKNSVFEKYDK